MIAIAANLQGNQRIQVRDLPAMNLVTAVMHRGPYSKLNQAYGAIVKWIEENDYQIAGYNREVY
ncbi:MAG: GyrI-like domain-containing protein [Leptolyngbyaceae cyanobacterium]